MYFECISNENLRSTGFGSAITPIRWRDLSTPVKSRIALVLS